MFKNNNWVWSLCNKEEGIYKFYRYLIFLLKGTFTWVQQFINQKQLIQGKLLE